MKNKIRLFIPAVAFLFVLIVQSSIAVEGDGVEFYAGAAVADITPDVKTRDIPLNGYGARKGAPSTGVHDRIFAKALIVESRGSGAGESSRAVIVTTDLCMVNRFMRDEIMARVKDLGITESNLMITASHTHSGPSAMDPRWPAEKLMGKYDPDLFEETVSLIAKAVREASGNLKPARAGITLGKFPDLVRNRRVEGYSYATRRFSSDAVTKPVDDMMNVLRVSHEDGSPIAVLVVFGSHATILGADNMLISADWPGVLQRELKESIGGDVVVMFANGAEGDQAPPSTDEPDDFAWMEWYGKRVSAAARKLWRNTDVAGGLNVAAAVYRERLPRIHVRALWGMPLPRPITESMGNVAIGSAIRIGPVALIGLPGEPVHKVVLKIRDRASEAGVEHPVVIGLANDWIGYIADPETYREGGYEAQATLFGKNESAVVTSAALKALDKILE